MSKIKWPQKFAELQRIDELLLCGICYDYMKTSVMTPCSHNYCSLCIRKYLHYKTQCPACFEKTFEKDLHTNRILDDLITYFGAIREKLVDCIDGARIEERIENVIDDSLKMTPVRPARSNQNQKKTPLSKENELTPKTSSNIEKITLFAVSPNTNEKKNSLKDFAQKSECKIAQTKINENEVTENSSLKLEKASLFAASPMENPSTSNTIKVAKIFTPKSKNNIAKGEKNKIVPCPVCKVEVSEIYVNKHLDDCLKRENGSQQCSRIEQKRKPLPKLVFSLMKDAELRKKLKELGLPSQGDRKTLETRFQRYSILYNAECDKIEPRSIMELLKQCEEEENLEKKMLKFSDAANRLKVTRNSEHNVIDEAQKKYLETNKEHFDSLIASIKDREKSSKLPVRRSLIDQNDELGENKLPEKNPRTESESEDDIDGAYSMLAYDNLLQDSDSSSCCPLQHYTSDDPIQFASIQMRNSNSNSPIEIPTKSRTLEFSPEKNKADNLSKDYSVITDSESNDEIPPSPKAAKRTSKRMKLSQTKKTDDKVEKGNLTKGQKLALSIIQSFTFDDSSNESLSAKPTLETETTKSAEIPNGDKENHESTSGTVNRPIRKRNSANSKKKVELTQQKESLTEADGKNIENSKNPRIDSPLKRRRGRKTIAQVEIEPTNPPRRPLRIRKSVTESTHKR